jgi:hypothetical protein
VILVIRAPSVSNCVVHADSAPLTLLLGNAPLKYQGFIAGQRIESALACAFLEVGDCTYTGHVPMLRADAAPALAVTAELEGQPVHLQVRHARTCSTFDTAEVSFTLDAHGNWANLARCADHAAPLWLFGPALILALAKRGVYCLHASAIEYRGTAIIVLGRSGAGKSTFGRAARALSGVRRLCDDITPIGFDATGQLCVWPQFPQLKLAAQEANLAAAVPVRQLVWLHAPAASQAGELEPLSERQLFEALTRHTVAARLYNYADTHAWWRDLARVCVALKAADAKAGAQHHAHSARAVFAAGAPEQAMLTLAQRVINH